MVSLEDFNKVQKDLLSLKQTQYELQEREGSLNGEVEKLRQQNALLSSELKKAKSILAGVKNKDQVTAVINQNEQLKRLVQQNQQKHKEEIQKLTAQLDESREKAKKLEISAQSASLKTYSPKPLDLTPINKGELEEKIKTLYSEITPKIDAVEGETQNDTAPSSKASSTVITIIERLWEEERQKMIQNPSTIEKIDTTDIEERMSAYESQILMWKEKANLKQNAVVRLKDENESLSKRLTEKEDTIEKNRKEVNRYKDELEIVRSDREVIMSKLSEKTMNEETLRDEKRELSNQLQELQLEFEELKTTKNSQIQTLQETIMHFQNEMDMQDRDLQQSKDSSGESQKELETLRELVKKQENDIKNMERMKSHVKTAREKVEQAEAARKKAEDETAVLTEALDKIRTERDKANARTEALQNEIKLMEVDNAATEEKQKEFESKIQSLQDQINEKAAEIKNKDDKIIELEETITNLRNEIEQQQTEHSNTESKLREELDGVNQKVTELKENILSLNETLSKKMKENEAERKILERKHAILVKELQTQLQKERAVREKLDPQGKILRTMKIPSEPFLSTSNPNLASAFAESEKKESGEMETVIQELTFLAQRVGDLQADKFAMENKLLVLEEELKKKNCFIQQGLIEKICEMHVGRTSASMDKDKNERLKKGVAMGQLFRSKSVADQELAAELIAKMERLLQETILYNFQLQSDMGILGNDVGELQDENKKLKKQLDELQSIK